MFCDTHCHILKEYYDEIDKVILEAKENGIDRLVVAADNYDSSLGVLELVKKYDNLYGNIGLHPENVSEDFDYSIFDKLSKKIVAIGEIGLDYHYGKENRDKQIEVFRKQLGIAEELNLPVVVHSRDATEDTINILKDYKVKGVIHSFSGSLQTAKIYLNMGFKLGVNGVVTFKNCKLKDVYSKLSPYDIVLETDSPYLTPHPFRGGQNSPKYVRVIAEYMANLFDISMEELADITNKNVADIFDIK